MPTSQHIGLYTSVQKLARQGFTDNECLVLSGAEGCSRDLAWVKQVTAVIRREQKKARERAWRCQECGRSWDVKRVVKCPKCQSLGA
jgi:predicted Zn-ribbon and HTH transcriptional regulator